MGYHDHLVVAFMSVNRDVCVRTDALYYSYWRVVFYFAVRDKELLEDDAIGKRSRTASV